MRVGDGEDVDVALSAGDLLVRNNDLIALGVVGVGDRVRQNADAADDATDLLDSAGGGVKLRLRAALARGCFSSTDTSAERIY